MTTATVTKLALLQQKITARRALPPPPRRRELRESAGVSLREVADVCGVSQTAVSHWEAGTKTPRGQHLTDYADVLRLLEAS